MRMLHEDEFDFLQSIINRKEDEIEIRSSDEIRGYLDAYQTQRFLNELVESHLIDIRSVKIDFQRGTALDAFLVIYSNFIQNNKIAEAKEFATKSGFSELNQILKEFKTIPEVWKVINSVLKDKPLLMDGDFEKDLYWNIFIKFVKKPELIKYLELYLDAFKNDTLTKPKPSKEEWTKITYFENSFYRYKKQRQLVVDLLKQKIETQNPSKIQINLIKELPIQHINALELFACLSKEGLIKSIDYLVGNDIAISVNEDMLNSLYSEVVPSSNKEIKLNLSFSFQAGSMTLKDQDGKEYKIRIQGQVQKEVLRVIFRNPKDTYTEWSLYEISDILGRNDVNETAVKNAIYQFNKKVKLTIPQISNLFELSKHSTQLNPKYVNQN